MILKNSHILITGANGFVGLHLTDALVDSGAKVTRLVRFAGTSINKKAAQIELDLTDRKLVGKVFSLLKPDFVIHLAAIKNRNVLGSQFRDSYDNNLSMSLNVIEACLELSNFKRLIFLGSCNEYGQEAGNFDEMQQELPSNAYGLSKLATTKILLGLYRSFQFPSIILRPSVIYGPCQGDEMFLPALIKSLFLQKDFAMTYGEQYRDFVYIDDVVDAIVKSLIADDQLNGLVINIAAGSSLKIKDIAILVANTIDKDANKHLKFGGVPYQTNEVMNYAVNINRAKQLLGWRPTTKLKQGLQTTVNYFRAQLGEPKIALPDCD